MGKPKCTFIENIVIDDAFIKIVNDSISVTGLVKSLGYSGSLSGKKLKEFKQLLVDNSIDFSHFTTNGSIKRGVYKICPICGKQFYDQRQKNNRHKKVCSRSCSNTLTPRTPVTHYRTICFKNNAKECIICGEDLIISVHHYDGDHKNNDPKNLIPLCPTHHQYMHSNHIWVIKECVDDFYLK